MKKILMIILFRVFSLIVLTATISVCSVHKSSLEGHWSGVAILNNEETSIKLDLVTENDSLFGNWSLPDLGMLKIPFQNFKFDADSGTILGDGNFINGTLEGNTISGDLNWHDSRAKFRIEKSQPEPLPYSQKEIEFHNGAVTLAGTLVIPEDQTPRTAVVFLHGSGQATRWQNLFFADRLARLGIASLIYDKRGSGKSTGNWTRSSLQDLAKDAISAIDFLKSQAEIQEVSLWGHSQGCWVASVASSQTDDISFMIMVSGGGATPYEEEMYSYQIALNHAGASEVDKTEANDLLGKYFNYLRIGQKRNELLQAIEIARKKEWYKFVAIDKILPSEKNRHNWSWVATYNPVPDIEKMKFPILLLFGENDTDGPVDLAVRNWKKGLSKTGNKDYTIKIFPKANHGIRLGGHHGGGNGWPWFADGYLETLSSWLVEHAVK